jgi:transcription initiation factor TFIIIB Brf1 subunit/transcription initiation factor TFIIB
MDKQCPVCGSKNIVYADGEMVCAKCGAVLGSPEMAHEFYHAPLGSEVVKLRGKLKRFNERDPARDDLWMLDSFASQLQVPQIVKDEAEFMIRRLYEKHLRGKVRDRLSVVLSVLYIACIKNGFIVEYRKFVKMGMNGRAYNKVKALVNTPIVRESPSAYIERYAQELGFSEVDVRNALNIIKEKGFSGTPRIAAIAALYVAKYGNDLTHISTVSKRAKMSHISLKNYVLKLL